MAAAGPDTECIVVRVVVRERTEGAGDENVLSAPCPVVLSPHPFVAFVACPDEGACEAAASECAAVDTVAAIDLFPMVGGE